MSQTKCKRKRKVANFFCRSIFCVFCRSFFFDILLYFTAIRICTTQNIIVSVLEPKPETKIYDRKSTNKPLEHKPPHRSPTPHHLTIYESNSKFLLAMHQPTDPSTTVFSFFNEK